MTTTEPNKHPVLTEKIFLDLIRINVPLEEHDAFHSGYCPFCYDEEESFLAYPHKRTWHCYACQQTGNIYNFIEKTQKLSLKNATEFVDTFINNTLHSTQKNKHKKSKHKEKNKSKTESLAKNKKQKPDQEKAVSDINLPLDNMLEKFQHCEGCRGLAVLATDTNKLLSSSLSNFNTQDIQVLNHYIKETFEQSKSILGNFDSHSSKQIFRMELIFQGQNMKLIWLPMLAGGRYNVLLLLESQVLETLLLLKLKKEFNHLD